MVGKAQMTIAELRIEKVVPTRDSSRIGHEFNLKAKLKVSKRTAGILSGEGIDYPELEWKESIDWFEHTAAGGSWHHKGTDRKDMYAQNPSSNTFKIWREMRYFLATDPSNNPPPGLKAAVDKVSSTEEKDKAAKHWIAENGFEWTILVATDRPALGLNPAAGSGGGGGESLVTSNSRRRVIHFDLGFKGTTRVSATQVLETINGKPTIHKFFHPAIPKSEADDPTKLALWRTQI